MMLHEPLENPNMRDHPQAAAWQWLAELVHVPVEELAQINLEQIKPLCDENGNEYLKESYYFTVTTTYGAQLEIPQTSPYFSELMTRLWQAKLC